MKSNVVQLHKNRPYPELCERCDQKITHQTGWGLVTISVIQAQPDGKGDTPQTIGLCICGHCGHDLAHWLCSDDEPETA